MQPSPTPVQPSPTPIKDCTKVPGNFCWKNTGCLGGVYSQTSAECKNGGYAVCCKPNPRITPTSSPIKLVWDFDRDGPSEIIDDYEALASCYGVSDKNPTSYCPNPSAIDLGHEGSVDGVDYNIWIWSLLQYQKNNGQ